MKLIKSFFKVFIPIMVFHYLIIQTSKVEGVSMQGTFYENDMIFVSRFSYGLTEPSIKGHRLGIFDDDHIITGEGPKHGDIITIKSFRKGYEENYIKRMVAKDGDEIIFTPYKIYIHSKDDDLKGSIRTLNGKKWHVNPYERQQFTKTFYNDLNMRIEKIINNSYDGVIQPTYIKGLREKPFFIKGEKYNAFYYKVPKGEYFVMGDNVNMSTDSRTFGPIKYKDILGKVLATFRM